MRYWFAPSTRATDGASPGARAIMMDMIVLGLVLLVLAGLLGVAIVVSNPAVLGLSLFGAQLPVTMAGLFFTGAGTMLAVVLALWLIHRGIARSRRQRRARKSLPAPVQPTPVQATSTPATRTSKTAIVATATHATESAAAGEATRGARSLEPDQSGSSTPAERSALLAETDQLTRDDPSR